MCELGQCPEMEPSPQKTYLYILGDGSELPAPRDENVHFTDFNAVEHWRKVVKAILGED